jgi:putative transposase
MPGRSTPLVTGEFYHIYNRGINHCKTFIDQKDFGRAQLSLDFYRFISPPMRLSFYLKLPEDQQKELWGELEQDQKVLVKIISYCLMGDHFHLLLRQQVDGGISKFMSNFQNSYTRYFNKRHKRDGSLFLDQFKAVRIISEQQLLHLSRYIHLNPYSSYLVKNFSELEGYSWSSFPEYIGEKNGFCDIDVVLSYFGSREKYKNFVLNQADYQRGLEMIKHLIFDT